MRIFISIAILVFLSACAGRSPREDGSRAPAKSPIYDLDQLQMEIGMDRSPFELGLTEKIFDSCRTRIKEAGDKCGARYLSVLNFKLSCRDSEGTVATTVSNFKPLVSDHVEFQLAGGRGVMRTDSAGYLQLKIVTTAPVRGQRLVVTVGKQFFGKEISEIDQIVLPNYWCE